MWHEIHEEVDALIQYSRHAGPPAIKAIKWQGRRLNIAECLRVAPSGYGGLRYTVSAGGDLLAIRFDPQRQSWTLEALDESATFYRESDIPPPRAFPPTNWK